MDFFSGCRMKSDIIFKCFFQNLISSILFSQTNDYRVNCVTSATIDHLDNFFFNSIFDISISMKFVYNRITVLYRISIACLNFKSYFFSIEMNKFQLLPK